MAGSLEPMEHKYFTSVAKALSSNSKTDHVVYQIVNKVEDTTKFEITKVNERYYTI